VSLGRSGRQSSTLILSLPRSGRLSMTREHRWTLSRRVWGHWDLLHGQPIERESNSTKIAVVLPCLEHGARKGNRYDEVQMTFESLVFPTGPDLDLLARINEARADMGTLVEAVTNQNRGELRWASNWLTSAGIQTTNPIDLMLVAHWWFTFWRDTEKVIRIASPSWN
jgi:hypothetical protein